jgi:hypothetical protein
MWLTVARCTALLVWCREISEALERSWGRYVPTSSVSSRTYSAFYSEEANDELARARAAVERFEGQAGRRPRILVAKVGQDGEELQFPMCELVSWPLPAAALSASSEKPEGCHPRSPVSIKNCLFVTKQWC